MHIKKKKINKLIGGLATKKCIEIYENYKKTNNEENIK